MNKKKLLKVNLLFFNYQRGKTELMDFSNSIKLSISTAKPNPSQYDEEEKEEEQSDLK